MCLGHFGTGALVSWVRTVLGPKCLGSEVSWVQSVCTTRRVVIDDKYRGIVGIAQHYLLVFSTTDYYRPALCPVYVYYPHYKNSTALCIIWVCTINRSCCCCCSHKRLDVRTSKPAKATTTRAKRKLFTTTIPFDFNTISVSGQIYRATTIPDASTITISASKIKP